MFMNYEKIYDSIVKRGRTREIKPGAGIEIHHIIPTCMGGSNDIENLTSLTPREHYICHWILTRIYPDNNKLSTAFFMMSNMKRCKVSSRAYQEAKETYRTNKIADKSKKTTKGYKYPNMKKTPRLKKPAKPVLKKYGKRLELVENARKHYDITGEILPGTPMKIVCPICKSYSSTFGHTKENCDKVLQKRLK